MDGSSIEAVSGNSSLISLHASGQDLGFENAHSSLSMMHQHHSELHGSVEDYLALGAICLDFFKGTWYMIRPGGTRYPHPHPLLTLGERRGWINTSYIQHASRPTEAALRIYALPEDVNRGSRGSIKDFRKVLIFLAEFIDTSPQTWHGNNTDVSVRSYLQPETSQEESMFYIFNTLNSPRTCLDDAGPLAQDQQSMYDVFHSSIPGLQTTLYTYQRRSIAAMLQKEVNPAKSRDPRKPQFRDINGTEFYFDVHEGVLLRHPHLYSQCRGGILAETMGYGKTLICIALILTTRGHYPNIPEGEVNAFSEEQNKRTPSLVDLAAKKAKQAGIPWKTHFAALKKDGYHFDGCLEALAKYDGEYAVPIFQSSMLSRSNKKREEFKVMRLAYATLLIIPPNLLLQWQNEIKKHTEEGALDVLVLDSTTQDIPHWKTLMEYDIILITKARFEQEYRDDDLNQGRRFRGQEKFRSQLTELRWLRVICDEGHSFASSSYTTHAMAMLDKMSIERRWVVSGTPSPSLYGVEVNLALNEANDAGKSRKLSLQTALDIRKTKDMAVDELRDMERLRALVVKFLKVQPWANRKGDDYADWKTYLHPFDSSGQRRYAPALRAILQSLMVRHRIEDIDADLSLPPLYNTAVYLEPSYYDKISMNLFRMVLTSNAVTSERVDEDYMFNPKNRKSLDELISNLRRASFHWVGFTENAVTETLRVSNKFLNEHLDSISDDDGALLTEAAMNGDRALKDSGWKAFSLYHEIGVYVQDFPDFAAEVWALNGEHSDPLLLGTVQARAAQQHVWKSAGGGDPESGLVGAGLRAMFAARERATEEQEATEKAHLSSSGNPLVAGTVEEPKAKIQSARFSSSARASKNEAHLETVVTSRKRSFVTASPKLPASLSKSKIIGFTSAKLNYLCSRILSLQDSEKIIIFYDSNNIAFWIAEALELLSVQFLIYANTLSVKRREMYLATFNKSETFRVLLMDLKQASRGLHVAAASRIFIVSPIWQPDVESQAIKRSHRIGQTRPVYVETLVLKGTLEEKILHRRKQMSNSELIMAEKSLLDDGTMNGIIRGEGFLKIDDGEKTEIRGGRLDVPVPLFERHYDGAAMFDMAEGVGIEDSDLITPEDEEREGNPLNGRGRFPVRAKALDDDDYTSVKAKVSGDNSETRVKMQRETEWREKRARHEGNTVSFATTTAPTGSGEPAPPPSLIPWPMASKQLPSIFGNGRGSGSSVQSGRVGSCID